MKYKNIYFHCVEWHVYRSARIKAKILVFIPSSPIFNSCLLLNFTETSSNELQKELFL